MGNPLDSAQFWRLMDNRLREVAEGEYKDLESMIPMLFRMLSSEGAFEEFYQIGDVPDIQEFTGKLEYLSISPGYYTKIEPKEFASGIQHERKLMDDKKYSVLENTGTGLMTSAHRVREKYAVQAFANAFSTAFDFQTSEEGKSLCSTTHTTKAGTSTASGFSNAGTSALDKTSVAATRLLMRKFRNDISERIQISDNLALIVPDNLVDTAREIVETPKGLETAEHTKNVQMGRFKIIPYMRLDDYSTSNWFMVDLDRMKKDLVWIDRIAPELKNTADFETYIVKQAVYMRIAYGWLGWRWIYGHNVS